MNIRRLRFRLAAAFMLASALSVGVMGWLAAGYGAAHIDDSAQSALQQRVADIAATSTIDNPPTDQPDGWFVDLAPNPPRIVKTGDADVEAGLVSIARDARDSGGSAFQHLTIGPDRFLLYARILPAGAAPATTTTAPDTTASAPESTTAAPATSTTTTTAGAPPLGTTAIVTAMNINDLSRSVRSLRVRIALTALAVVLVSGVIGYWLAGRSLLPARRAAEQQREFLANAAHELRTPLAIIQASASQALAHPRAQEDYVRALAEIRSAAERAGVGVGELLDLARLDAGQAVPRRASLRLDLLVEEVVASVPAEQVELELPAPEPVIIDADLSLMRQALQNVILNATHRAGRVTVSVTREGKEAVVTVADNGPGFPPELLPQLFTRFARGDHAGSGLGLAIVRSVVTAHGGSVAAANASAGGGVVTIRLPLIG